ncbi:MAG: HesA/MoeB/ThiF family protein [Paracoccaceae bacterium]
MMLVFGLAVLIWAGGRLLGGSVTLRLRLLAGLYAVVLGLTFVLPLGHPLRVALGGDAVIWAVLGGVVALVLGYRAVLRVLRDKAKVKAEADVAAEHTPPPGQMSDSELTRYARHIVMREIGGMGQKRLKAARVLVVGAGGLGAPALQYLAAAGVGTIGIVDDDVVDLGNLQRQVIHTDDRIGMAKVFSAEIALRALNPTVEVRPYQRRLSADDAEALIADYDIVLDGTDNFDTRYLVNRAAVAAGVPLVSGALSQWEGQLSVFDPKAGAPCYQCIFPAAPAAELAPSCAEAGVLGPLPGVMGAMMAVETVKLITRAGHAARGDLVIYDALWGETRKITLTPRPDCPVCGGQPMVEDAPPVPTSSKG